MDIFLLSRSESFKRHIKSVASKGYKVHLHSNVDKSIQKQYENTPVFLLHASSYKKELTGIIEQIRSKQQRAIIAIATDIPELHEMLALARYQISAYFNSYMADVHYQQMLRLLGSGQTWFAPDLLAKALELAGRASARALSDDEISRLTTREKDVTRAIARGLSNKEIASSLNISERTVKSHLTHIFEKLDIKDRTTLAIRLNATTEPTPQQSVG